jgi:hypothetical protein
VGPVSGAFVFALAEFLRRHQTIPPMRTATARIAKAIQPHWVVLDSSFCDAAAAAAAAAGLTPDVVVAGGWTAATTVVVRDSVTVGVGCVVLVTATVGVDRVGVVTDGVSRVGVARVAEVGVVPTADPSPPPHAVRNPMATNAIVAAAPRGCKDR